jgi:acetyl esterase/lipase
MDEVSPDWKLPALQGAQDALSRSVFPRRRSAETLQPMPGRNHPQHPESVEGRGRSAGLPAELTLRFGADRLPGRVHWPSPIARSVDAPLVLLIADEDLGAAAAFAASLCAAASAVVLSISALRGTRTFRRSADGVVVQALAWVTDHAADLGGDPQLMAVAGSGKGGASAARLATAARDEGWPRLRRQLLVNPLFGPADPMPTDVTGVAPASIATARGANHEGPRYAELLRAAGIDVEEIALARRGVIRQEELRRLTRPLRPGTAPTTIHTPEETLDENHTLG